MVTYVPREIADSISYFVQENCLEKRKRLIRNEGESHYSIRFWRYDLLSLKATNQRFRYAVDRLIFRELGSEQIDLYSLARMRHLLGSPSICSAVREYTFSPRLCLVRPKVGKNAWSYYGEFYNGRCGPEPRYSELRAEHEMRLRVARHYDEQLRILGAPIAGLSWFWNRLNCLMHGIPPGSANQGLRVMPYFADIHKLWNLRTLHISCSVPRCSQDNTLHYTIKNEMMAGLANVLLDCSSSLETLEITLSSLTDVKHLVEFMEEKRRQASVKSIKKFQLRLAPETLSHRGGIIQTYDEVHVHASGGAPLSDLLSLFPNIETLGLHYGLPNDSCFLVIQDSIL